MKPSKQAFDIIREFEGYHTRLPDGSCKAYLDKLVRPALRSPGYNGLWTIGYGSTGSHVTEGTVWTKHHADEELNKVVNSHGRLVNKLIKVPLNQNQFDALTSLSYNLGLHKAKSLIKRLNEKDYAGAAKAFKLYNKAGGKVVRGLTRRRQREMEMFLLPDRQEVIDASRKLTFLQRLRLFVVTLGIPGYLTWENFEQARELLADNAGAIVLAIGIIAWVTSKMLEKYAMEDYKRGDWTPSGLSEVKNNGVGE